MQLWLRCIMQPSLNDVLEYGLGSRGCLCGGGKSSRSLTGQSLPGRSLPRCSSQPSYRPSGPLAPARLQLGASGPLRFGQRLRELGWIEGRTVVIEYRWADGRSERFPEIAAEFVRLVDVIVNSGSAVPGQPP